MKICFLGPIAPTFLAPYLKELTVEKVALLGKVGGTGLAPLVIEAIKEGHKVEIISLYQNLAEELIFEENNVKFVCLPSRKEGLGKDFYKKERKHLLANILNSDSDIINAHWTYEYALAALESEKKNVIITARDCPRDVLKYSDYRYWPLYIISRIVYSKANNLITVSPYVYDYIQKFNKNKISVIPNAVNNEVFKLKRNERIITNNNFTIVSALQWNRLKNAKNAIIAFSLFRKKIKNSRYLLIGRNLGENQQAQKWAQDNKLADGISFIGSIPYDDYIKEMQKADVYFHPSRTEACSMAISDALVMGIPVIGGRKNGGVPWQLQWGLGGLLTDVENHQSMAETLLEVYINKNDYLKNIIEAGHHWSEEWLKMEKVFTRYLSIYEKLKK